MNLRLETVERIEPARLEEISEAISDVVAELSAATAKLGYALHPQTAAHLADLVRIMNTYYSNLIEGHNTRPRDIERAIGGHFDNDEGRRNLQIEAAAHVHVQSEIDSMALDNRLPEPASIDFILWLHREFYRDASPEMLRICGNGTEFTMEPGTGRSRNEHTLQSAGISHLPASVSRPLWNISRSVIASNAWARRRGSSPFQRRIIASTTFIRSRTAMVVSAA